MTDRTSQHQIDALRSRVAVLEQLQEELERIVADQSRKLQQAVAEAHARAEQLSRSEAVLQQRTRILHSVIESIGHGLVVTDEEGKFRIFNRTAKDILRLGESAGSRDLTPDEWTAFFGLYLPDQITPFPTDDLPLMRAMRGETVTAAEIYVRHARTPEEGVWLIVTACPLRDEQGAVRGGVAVFRDVTEQRRAEEALAASERRFRGLFEKSPDPIFVEDLDGNVLDVNPAACQLHGSSREELIGKNLLDLVPAEHREAALKEFSRLARGEIDHAEGYSWTRDGRSVPVEVRVSWVDYTAETGTVPAILIHVHDLTERKRHEQELVKARAAAEAASQAKSDFLSSMSHEIRTPMNAVLGLSELLLETELTGEQRDHVRLIKKSGDALLGVINAVLDFSKIEADRLELSCRPFGLHALVHDLLDTLRVRARQKGLRLLRQIAPDVPDRVAGDDGRLRQVLMNLIGNAIKFTESGEVSVSVGLASGGRQPPEGHVLHFEVRDTGIGIPSDKLPLLFQPFSQVDSGVTRKFEGTGLGLVISKRLVELMGGQLGVESIPERGSTFWFQVTLGRASKEEEPRPTTPAEPGRPLRILLAEDNPINQRLAVALLEKRGHRVTLATTGRQAVVLLGQRDFDVVLMDVQMPEMDGLEATRQIRGQEATGARRVSIIAMTAYALKGDRERCLDAGMDDYVSKPIRSQELFEALARHAPIACFSPPPPARMAADDFSVNGFDPAGALRHVGGDVVLLRELIGLFLADAPRWFTELRLAVQSGDAPTVRRSAHNLKGAMVHFELRRAVEAAHRLEILGRNVSLDDAGEALEALERELDLVRPQLTAYLAAAKD